MLIIPNSTDTTSGNKYAALDQAEPDSLDFEILGNTGRSGVVSGLAVTSNSSAANVAVAAGVIALNGAAYAVAASATYALPSAPADNRYDLIVARVSGGVASLVTISGTNSATNPTFPRSRSVITGVFNASAHVDLDTDVVIAAIYRTGSTVITTSRILDRRAMQTSGIVTQGTSVPNSGVGSGPGNLYFKSNTTDGDGTESGVYVRLANGSWIGLAKDIGLHVPIGAEIGWPTSAPVPDRFAEPTGQALATATYPTLFGLYGYENGGSGGTFLLPDHRNVFLRSTDNTALVGNSLGSDSVTLSTDQLPPHTHSNSHTHPNVHEHTISHGHTGSTAAAGSHNHAPGTLAVRGLGGRDPMLREPAYTDSPYVTAYQNNPANGLGRGRTTNDLGETIPGIYVTAGMVISQVGTLVVSGVTATQAAHTHVVTVNAFSGSTSAQSTSTTGDASPALTGSSGGGAPVSTIPAAKYTRNIIRVS